MGTSWLRPLPYFVFVFFAFFTTVLSVPNKLFEYDSKTVKILAIYIVIAFVLTTFSPYFSLFIILQNFAHATVIVGVILLKDCYKARLFDLFVKALSVILLITIPAWLLFLKGFPFSHGAYIDVGDGFHFIHDYTFFVMSDIGEGFDYPRFSSVFLEPGWIGTICCFTIFGLGLNFRKIPTWLCLLGLLLSMSLSAVVNLILCVLLWIWLTSKHRLVLLGCFAFLLIGVTVFATSYKKGDNIINQLVVERLIFDEDLGIAGNNRTNDDFDSRFEDVVRGPEKWFGIGHEVNKEFMEANDWFNHSSGIKKDLMCNGFFGTGLYMLLLIMLLIKFRCKEGFVFFVCFIMASFIRDMWRSDCYLILYIVSLCILYVECRITYLKPNKLRNVRIVKAKSH